MFVQRDADPTATKNSVDDDSVNETFSKNVENMILKLCQNVKFSCDNDKLQEVFQIKIYWRFNNYVASYESQEFKDLSKPQNKRHKKRHALFHSQRKGITYSLVNNNRHIS